MTIKSQKVRRRITFFNEKKENHEIDIKDKIDLD